MTIEALRDWIDLHRDEMVEALRGVLRIASTKEPAAGDGAPYGRSIRAALDYTLDLAKNLGFRIADVDGHAGHAEFGEGDEMVAAFGHLDVVPAGDGWRFDPFGAHIEAGRIYARGSSDDKGPTYAALYAAKALMESGLPLRRRVRVIFGCDEESGFGCVKHYWEVAKQERPVLGFTPDAYFPGVYAEKGIAGLVLEKPLEGDAELRVAEARGGRRGNMVPDYARARLTGTPQGLYASVVALHAHWDANVSIEPEADALVVHARGKSGHASRPHSGDNAIARLAGALLACDLPADRAWLRFVAQSCNTTGAGLGIQGSDDVAGPLTCNAGILEVAEGRVQVQYNIRYPVSWTVDHVLERARAVVERAGWTIARHTDSPPLHVPIDAEPAKTLLRVYQEETGDTESRLGTMGGGTYARATPNAIAFGAVFPASPDGPAHEPNESIAISSLVRAAQIYAHALYELAK